MARDQKQLCFLSLWIGCVLASLPVTAARAAVTTASTWQRWEQPLTSAQTTLLPIQAYHDTQVEATFWVKSGSTCIEPTEGTCTLPNTCFKGLAFWDGDAFLHPRDFKLRTALPSGSWCWKTCLLPKSRPITNQPSVCTSDAGLNQSGEITVASASATNPLYSNGFLKAPLSKRSLTYWNGQTPFQWIGDTAWNAPINHQASPSVWTGYVTKRANAFTPPATPTNPNPPRDGFTNVLVAPASQTQIAPPTGGFRGFVTPSGCGAGTTVVPTSCHYWDSAYWRDFDVLVKDANDQGIVVVVADVMDPLNRGGSNQMLHPPVLFPTRADSTAFARNLAARLAGSFVVFSPSFDVHASDNTAESGISAAGLISAVGAAIHSAAPRHLIGVHLAGGSAWTDYDQFQSQPWLNLQIFQSGHKAGACDDAGVNDPYATFACRARTFSLRFRCLGDTSGNPTCPSNEPTGMPSRPAVNVEGQYETLGDNETRVQTRHTAWNSGLSGSFGFNIGVFPDITYWSNPLAYDSPDHHSDEDLARLKGLFKSMPWTELTPRHDFLVDQNADPNIGVPNPCAGTSNSVSSKADWLQLWKPLLAIDSSNSYGLAYLPRPMTCKPPGSNTPFIPTTNIVLVRAKATALKISCATFRGKWVSPGDQGTANGFGMVNAACADSGNGPVIFSVQSGQLSCSERCDRVLVLTRRTKSTDNSPNVVATGSTIDLETSITLSDDGQTSTVTGQLWRNGFPLGGETALSGTNAAFRKLPSVALDATSNFLVAWEEENADGTDDIVAARFGNRLTPIGTPFVLNDTTVGQQSEPWVSGDDSGNMVAVWTNYSDDDTIAGDIYGKVLDSSGQPLGPEFLISTDNLGNQILPQVQMDGGGGFVVAWTDESADTPPPQALAANNAKAGSLSGTKRGVYYRVFNADGQPRGASRHVETGNAGQDRLSRLEVKRHGGFKLHWHSVDATGHDQGEREQDCDREGNPTGGN